MKKVLFFFLLLVISRMQIVAQLIDGTTAPDFTLTDINGNSFHLYDALNAGKTVILNFSTTWSEASWNYHVSGAMEELYESYGPDGSCSNDVVVAFIESDAVTNIDDLNGTGNTTQGDWISGSTFPIYDIGFTSTILTDYQVEYFPMVYRICPSKLTKINDQITAHAHIATIEECSRPFDAAISSVGKVISCGDSVIPAVSIRNVDMSALTTAKIAYFVDGSDTIFYHWSGNLGIGESAHVMLDTLDLATGPHDFRFLLLNPNDTTDYNGTNNCTQGQCTVITSMGAAVPYLANLSSEDFPYENWITVNPDYEIGWKHDPLHNGCLFLDCFNYGDIGQQDSLYLEPLDFSTIPNPTLSFDLAYATYNNDLIDGLGVMVSLDCGQNWTEVFYQQGAELSSANQTANAFYPGDTDWKSECIDLSGFSGNQHVFIAFVGYNGFGNNLFLDNFSVNTQCVVSVDEISEKNNGFYVYPNPAADRITLNYELRGTSRLRVEMVDVFGKKMTEWNYGQQAPGIYQQPIDLNGIAAGIYFLRCYTGDDYSVIRFIVK